MSRGAVIGIFVLLFSSIKNDQAFKSLQFRRFKGYRFQSLVGYNLSPKPARSSLDCAGKCRLPECGNFVYISSNKTCHRYGLWDATFTIQSSVVSTSTPSYMETSLFSDDGWIKVYLLKAGGNCWATYTIIYPNAEYIRNCYKNLGSDFFRSPLLDSWNQLPLNQVKLVIYKNNKAVVTMIFNGKNSTLGSVFSINRVVSSPWNDLTPATTSLMFGLNVWQPRKFYFANVHYSCTSDTGWLFVSQSHLCSYDSALVFPKILYSKTTSSTNWNTEYETGDYLALYINLL
ncbi:uncharacterized protein LOC118764338 [Octopus sinensis]|uniref:Uncharacterized protein LOC118764338 n=1 Tax=Octopus sinensis TaxID=2607531 RepID=A0A7E6EZ42_9MOLL|nr:uncharacterized protein LOC118764338 [Octopus sinensis]